MIDVTAKIIMTIKYNGRLLFDSHALKIFSNNESKEIP